MTINKKQKNLPSCGFRRSNRLQSENLKKNENRDKYLDLVRERKKAVEHEKNGAYWRMWDSSHWVGKGVEKVRYRETNRHHSNSSTVKIRQNTEKSP